MKALISAAKFGANKISENARYFSSVPKGLKIGIFGYGNMASEIFTKEVIRELAENGNEVYIFGTKPELKEDIPGAKYISTKSDSSVKNSVPELNVGISAMKPQVSKTSLAEYAKYLGPNSALGSFEAGTTTRTLYGRMLGATEQIIRYMPNTNGPRGLAAFCTSGRVDESLLGAMNWVFNKSCQLFSMEEERINAFTAVAGSGPAYAHHIFNSIARSLHRCNEEKYPISKAESLVLNTAINFDNPAYKSDSSERVKESLKKLEGKGSTESIILDAFEDLNLRVKAESEKLKSEGKDPAKAQLKENELKSFTAAIISRISASLIKGAELCGFKDEMVEAMIIGDNGIIKASANKALITGKTPSRLKWEVTSMEGTTQEGLARGEVGTGRTLDELWSQTMQHAMNRGSRLGDPLGAALTDVSVQIENFTAQKTDLDPYRKKMAAVYNAITGIFAAQKESEKNFASIAPGEVKNPIGSKLDKSVVDKNKGNSI